MIEKRRDDKGKFTQKSLCDRQVRSIRATDAIWEKFGEMAEAEGVTRADLLEEWIVRDKKQGDQQLVNQIEKLVEEILQSAEITRKGKDRGAVKRGLRALLKKLLIL